MNSFKFPLPVLFFALYISSVAQYQLDTVSVKMVSDGVKHLHLLENNIPWNINVLEVDLTNPYLSIETAHAEDNISGRSGTTVQAKLNSFEGHEVVGAINADFFDGDGITTGHQVIDGELLRSIQSRNWSKIAFDEHMKPTIERYNFSGEVIVNSQVISLDGINRTRDENHVILYNSYMGTSTGQNQWGTEVLLQPLTDWMINDTVRCLIEKLEQQVGNMAIEEDRVVLSAHGTKEDLLISLNDGDTVSIAVNLAPETGKIIEMVSGFPQIVKNGDNYALEGYVNEGGTATFATDRHPRTGIGFNVDSTMLYLFVVDGRQAISKGVSLIELADIMITMGVHEGLNLDGGGSTTMVVKNDIVNYPSDGSERPVGNSLLVVSSEPVVIGEVNLYPDTVVTNLELPVQFWFDAFDRYGYNHKYPFSDAFVSLSNNDVGTISSTGLFAPAAIGFTDITASIDNGLGLSKLSVEVHEGEYLISSMEDIQDWILTGSDIDLNKSSIELNSDNFSEGSGSIQLNYGFEYETGKYYYAYLNTDIPIQGVPEAIKIDALGNEYQHTLAFIIADENEEEFALVCDNRIDNSESFEEYTADFSSPIEQTNNARFYYPVRIRQIAVVLGSSKEHGVSYKGYISFDNLRIKYPDPVSVADETTPDEFRLFQNYPNPFNPSTTITYTIPNNVGVEKYSTPTNVKLIMYDLLGQEIAVLVNEFQRPGNYKVVLGNEITERLSSGVYLYKLTAGKFISTKKLLLLK